MDEKTVIGTGKIHLFSTNITEVGKSDSQSVRP